MYSIGENTILFLGYIAYIMLLLLQEHKNAFNVHMILKRLFEPVLGKYYYVQKILLTTDLENWFADGKLLYTCLFRTKSWAS